jgi:hypothetical protein
MKGHFLPFGYTQTLCQRLLMLRQGAKSVDDYTEEFYHWLLETTCQRLRGSWWRDTWAVWESPYKTSLVSTPSGRFLKPTSVP